MRTSVKNPQQAQSAPVADVSSTKRTNLDKLTKSELITLLEGRIGAPLTPTQLLHCAIAAVAQWHKDVVADNYASTTDVASKLKALEAIYHNR